MNEKIALVTGTSRGIGAETAKVLGRKGYSVCAHYYKNANLAEKVVENILKAGGSANVTQADISKEAEIVEMFEHIDKQYGSISALVNNAGFNGGFLISEEITMDNLLPVFSLNVFGVFICIREAVKRMKKIGRGSIVNVSSEAARFGGHNLTHYAASKAAINTATIGFARELAPYNIRVNAVSPGIIDTDIQKNISNERRKRLENSLPFKRMGKPEEVAKTIAWLLSEDASYISGSIVSVSGAR
ncbi:MAG: SDR family oxidoreductase [Phycisphaerales bacterium]|jgi:NAD(P)-dependent dehydrogenase (short-subunit alcohol dehydrogenase family)